MTSAPTTPLVAGYRIEKLAARGGMGVVYRATQLSLGRPVALKVISPQFADDPHFRERFQRESRLAASVDHPNVIPVYEAGETDGCLFISMRWVEGTDLNSVIKRSGGIDPQRAAAIVAQLGAALDAAHGCGLLHRDVKPANVLIAAGGHVYLTDFGLVKRMAGSAKLTRSGDLLGTVDYIAPEQIRGAVDRRSDVYSLGCVLFHCLTGTVPFEADDDVAKIYAHLNNPPPRPSDVVPGVPAGLDEVVRRAMAKDPDDRYQSAGELGAAAVAAAGVGAEDRPTVASGRPAPRRRRWMVAAAIVAAAGAAVVFVVSGLSDGRDERVTTPRPASAKATLDNGTLVRARGTRTVYLLEAGAKFPITRPQRAALGYERTRPRIVSRHDLAAIPAVPPDGSLVRTDKGTTVWKIRDGTRHLADAAPGADVAVIPQSSLKQIPPPQGGQHTSTTLTTPATITDKRVFLVVADVRSGAGTPRGACVFYRVALSGLKERAHVRTHDGRCEAHLKVGGVARVRYSVHFVGADGWRGSTSVTPPIPVVAQP
jgi:hypothetical protein